MNHRNLLLPLALAAGLSLAAQPAGGPPACGPPPGAGGVPLVDILRFGDKIALGQDQVAAIQAVLQAHQDALQSTSKAARDADDAFQSGLVDPAATTDGLADLHAAAGAARLAAASEQRATYLAALAILRADQVAQLKDLQAQIRQLQDALQALLAPPAPPSGAGGGSPPLLRPFARN